MLRLPVHSSVWIESSFGLCRLHVSVDDHHEPCGANSELRQVFQFDGLNPFIVHVRSVFEFKITQPNRVFGQADGAVQPRSVRVIYFDIRAFTQVTYAGSWFGQSSRQARRRPRNDRDCDAPVLWQRKTRRLASDCGVEQERVLPSTGNASVHLGGVPWLKSICTLLYRKLFSHRLQLAGMAAFIGLVSKSQILAASFLRNRNPFSRAPASRLRRFQSRYTRDDFA